MLEKSQPAPPMRVTSIAGDAIDLAELRGRKVRLRSAPPALHGIGRHATVKRW